MATRRYHWRTYELTKLTDITKSTKALNRGEKKGFYHER
jgi:hypothetical protein